MKKLFTKGVLILITLGLFVFSSCEKEEEPVDDSPVQVENESQTPETVPEYENIEQNLQGIAKSFQILEEKKLQLLSKL